MLWLSVDAILAVYYIAMSIWSRPVFFWVVCLSVRTGKYWRIDDCFLCSVERAAAAARDQIRVGRGGRDLSYLGSGCLAGAIRI